MTYLINYDLAHPGQNYARLTQAIQTYGSWAKISQSCWAIRTAQTTVQIRDYLAQNLDNNDLLFICPFSDWASWNLSANVLKWLNNN